MSTFTDAAIEYLNSQPLGRLATVGPDGGPHVVPLGVYYDPESQGIVIGGYAGSNMAGSKKCKRAFASMITRVLDGAGNAFHVGKRLLALL